MIRKIARRIHLWIGLITGAVVFVVCITGCIYAFQKEIRMLIDPAMKVESFKHKQKLSTLLDNYSKKYQKPVYRIYDFKDPNRSTIFLSYQNGSYFFDYINPYDGRFLKSQNLRTDFFYFILRLHMNLALDEVGKQIVGWSVVLFIISLLTGLILWLPKNKRVFLKKKGLKSKFTIQLKTSKKRKIYNLHSVLGFYGSSLLIVLAITGLGWTFAWFDNFLYYSVTLKNKPEQINVEIDSTKFNPRSLDYSKLNISKIPSDYNLYVYFLPNKLTDPIKIINYKNDDQYGSSNIYYTHTNSGSIIYQKKDIEKNAGDKFHDLYYDIHTGSLLGLGGKILAFFVSLMGASLPITGVLMYLKKKSKK